VIPQATLAEINKRHDGATAGAYISTTDLLYFVESNTDLTVHKRKFSRATAFKGNDARMLKLEQASDDTDSVVGPDLKCVFINAFGVPEATVKKMSLADFGKTRFLTCENGSMRDLSMEELQTALEGGEESIPIDAITFPVNAIFYGAVGDKENTDELLKFMRQEKYTGRELEIYTPQGRFNARNQTFKPILRKALEKLSALFIAASGTIGTALIVEIITASMAAGILTFACPPVFLTLLGLAVGLLIVGAILIFVASRIENTVTSLPAPQPQPT
jgi:hypothetical protein